MRGRPSLASAGAVRLAYNDILPGICNVGLQGANVKGKVDLARSPNLVRGDGALLKKGGVASPVHCDASDVNIQNEADYNKVMADEKLRKATDLGHVTLAWKDMTSQQLKALLGDVVEIHGGVFMEHMGKLGQISLPSLKAVNGSLDIIQCNAVQLVSLPSLEAVSGTFLISLDWYTAGSRRNKLAAVRAPRLKSLGALYFFGTEAAKTIEMTALATVDRSFEITIGGCHHDPELKVLELPSLTAVGGVFGVERQRRLQQLSLPLLRSVGQFALQDLALLPSICDVGQCQRVATQQSERG